MNHNPNNMAPGSRPVGEFKGYVDGEPAVTWHDRDAMPQAGAVIYAVPRTTPKATAFMPRYWSLLLTSENHGAVGPAGSTFPHAGEKHERVVVMEIVEAGSPPAPGVDLAGLVVLNLAELIGSLDDVGAWARELPIPTLGTCSALRKLSTVKGALVASQVAAQAGQVAVPENWPTSDMVDAGGAAVRRGYSGAWRDDRKPDEMLCSYIFRHMIAAAPSPAKESK